MPPLARFSDVCVGRCCCHSPIPCVEMSGIVFSFASTATSGALGIGYFPGFVMGGCGHLGMIITGMPTANVEGLGAPARMTDSFVGCFTGTIIGGDATTVA